METQNDTYRANERAANGAPFIQMNHNYLSRGIPALFGCPCPRSTAFKIHEQIEKIKPLGINMIDFF